MAQPQTLEIPVSGMDCAECTQHVRQSIAHLPGVEAVDVFLASEKAIVRLDPDRVDLPTIRRAVEGAGYRIPLPQPSPRAAERRWGREWAGVTRRTWTVLGVVFGAVLFVVVVGEWLGLSERLTALVPYPVGLALVLLIGWPNFVNVVRAALRKQITSHTLMSLGALAAVAVGEWATAAVVAFFMRVGDYTENLTTEGARRAVKDLTAIAPQTARVRRDGAELEVPVAEVRLGETVIVRPGEKLPVDGVVISGQATLDQSIITGESMPVEAGPGSPVFAASLARLGSIRVQATRVGPDTTFGRVVKLVEEAEAHRAAVQRFADKFTGYYLPIVASVALLTFLIRRDPLAAAAVLVVACSCSIALATPVAVLASIGAGAKRGLLIKGGRYLELLARADVLLVDKTGTLTLGQPQITDIVPLNGLPPGELLALAASAEKYSEHPLAEAVRAAARARNISLVEPQNFESIPGLGVRASLGGDEIVVGNRRMLAEGQAARSAVPYLSQLESQGKTVLFLARNGELGGLIAAADTLRSEVPAAIAEARACGIRTVELLTGDNELAAADLAAKLGVDYRANLLPEDKIAIVKAYQAAGHTVVMVGDGVNDAPALAQSDVGIAMGTAGIDVAIEAAHVALMRDDWTLVPEVLRIARRTMNVIKLNLVFTALYNVSGLVLAATGLLPPVLAAAAQSLPDLGILANSARLLRQGNHDA